MLINDMQPILSDDSFISEKPMGREDTVNEGLYHYESTSSFPDDIKRIPKRKEKVYLIEEM